jgi:ribonucleoside-diphosphate reductase alpha chain
MKLSDNALKVLEKRYFMRDDSGAVIEDWSELITRVANNVAQGEPQKAKRYYDLLDSGTFLPNSPTLMNAGSDLQQLSACFVLPIDDSMDSIFETLKNAALIHKSGGGTGFSFNRLREANSRVRSTNGVSSGPLSFMKVFNAATDAVKQGGTRRGANMAILNVDHPQIIDFITCKADVSELTNFNISVGITEDFMRAVFQDEEYDLISPHTGQSREKMKARDVFELIVEMAHKNGEPGIVFLDRINLANPTPALGCIESTNPCGEQPLLPNEACNLGSVNLALFARDGGIAWDELRNTVRTAVDFLDNVIDVSHFPLPQIDSIVKANRKIGLGIMGWADLLFQLRIPYASERAIDLARDIMEFIDFEAKQQSMELAKQKTPFPNFQDSVYAKNTLVRDPNKLDWDALLTRISSDGIRNATVTTIAPTGTISMILDTASGIEPQFSLAYVKNVLDGEKLVYANKWFEQALQDEGLLTDEILQSVSQSGTIANLESIPDHIKAVFQTAHDISPEWHIRMQAAFQKYTDNAVSKTINFPNHATTEDIRTAYELAYQLGCKGVTVYRDGSRQNQVLSTGSGIQTSAQEQRVGPRTRPEVTHGITQRLETGCGHMYVTINNDSHGACEVFVQMGKVGGCASAQLEAIARLSSLALRSDIRLEAIIRQLKGIRCQSPMWHKGQVITSCGDAVGRALENFVNMHDIDHVQSLRFGTAHESSDTSQKYIGVALCPDCGTSTEHLEGCLKCPSCGWSKC